MRNTKPAPPQHNRSCTAVVGQLPPGVADCSASLGSNLTTPAQLCSSIFCCSGFGNSDSGGNSTGPSPSPNTTSLLADVQYSLQQVLTDLSTEIPGGYINQTTQEELTNTLQVGTREGGRRANNLRKLEFIVLF